MATVIEIINGISQAIHAKHEGGAEFGLKRETEPLLDGCSIYDPRVMDGFGVQFQGDRLILKYHSEMPLVKVHDKNFETEIRRVVKAVCDHIKTEYKTHTKTALGLTEEGDIQIMVQTANRRTCYVNAVQVYKINNMKIDNGETPEQKKIYDTEESNFSKIAKRWLMNVRS